MNAKFVLPWLLLSAAAPFLRTLSLPPPPDSLQLIDSSASLIHRKLEDKLNYLRRRHNSFLRQNRQLHRGELRFAANNAVYGFGWQNGNFMRCPDAEHFQIYFNSDGTRRPQPLPVLFNRYNGNRRRLAAQMQCMLYVRFVRLSRLVHIGFVELEVHLRSNCMRTVLNKFFIVPFHERFPNRILLIFNQIRFNVRTRSDNYAFQGKNMRRLVREFALINFYSSRRFIVNKPETIFPQEIRYNPDVEVMRERPLPFQPFNGPFVIIPKTPDNPVWTLDEIRRFWTGPNPQDCRINIVREPLRFWDRLRNQHHTVTERLANIQCNT